MTSARVVAPTTANVPQPKVSLLSRIETGIKEHPRRVVIYGIDGVGKTQFAANAPKPVFICPERGAEKFDVSRFHPTSWREVLQVVTELTTAEHDYKTIVIDTLDWLEPMLFKHVVGMPDSKGKTMDFAFGGYQKAYNVALDEWRELLRKLDTLSTKRTMEVILIAHGVARTFMDPDGQDYERWTLKLWETKGANTPAVIREWADYVLFAKFETIVAEVGAKERVKGVNDNPTRLLYTTWSLAHDAKRHGFLPNELPLDYHEFVRACSSGVTDTPEEIIRQINEVIAPLSDAQKERINSYVTLASNDRENLLKTLNVAIVAAQQKI